MGKRQAVKKESCVEEVTATAVKTLVSVASTPVPQPICEVKADQAATMSLEEMGFSASDILIPKILLMQSTSVLVQEGTCQPGDMVNSVTSEKLGDKKAAFSFIPVLSFKTWVIMEEDGNKFIRQVPTTPENVTWEREGVDTNYDGDTVRVLRYQALNFYVLAASEVSSGEAFPYLLSFRSTSYQAGKKVATHFAKMNMFRKFPWSKSLSLSCYVDKNDRGTFHVYDILPGVETSGGEKEAARMWKEILAKGQHKVDESDLAKPEAAAAESTQY